MKQHTGVRVFTPTGVTAVPGLSRTQRTLVAQHWNAIRRYLEYGDDTALVDLERDAAADPGTGVVVAGHRSVFDLDAIEYHASRGDVSFESIYDEVL